MIQQNRRTVLKQLVGIALGTASFSILANDKGQENWLLHLGEFERIGEKYLQEFPEEEDLNKLEQYILGESISEHIDVDPNWEMQKVLGEIESDFQKNIVVSISGWMLSKTECRLCALIFILSRNNYK